jgi:hypothetical protein
MTISLTAAQRKDAEQALTNLREATPLTINAEARDWAGFFQALSQFLSVMLPLILPLFTTNNQN